MLFAARHAPTVFKCSLLLWLLPKGLFFQLELLHAFTKTAYIDSKTALIVFPGLYSGNQKQWNMISPFLCAGFFANAFFLERLEVWDLLWIETLIFRKPLTCNGLNKLPYNNNLIVNRTLVKYVSHVKLNWVIVWTVLCWVVARWFWSVARWCLTSSKVKVLWKSSQRFYFVFKSSLKHKTHL